MTTESHEVQEQPRDLIPKEAESPGGPEEAGLPLLVEEVEPRKEESEIDKLAQELTAIQARNEERRGSLSLLAAYSTPETPTGEAALSEDGVIEAEIDSLLAQKLEAIDAGQYMIQAGQAYQRARQCADWLDEQGRLLVVRREKIFLEREETSRQIRDLDRAKGLRRAKTLLSKRKLLGKEEALTQEHQDTKRERRAYENKRLDLLQQMRSLADRQQDVFLSEGEAALKEARGDYVGWIEKLDGCETLYEQIREAYIGDNILPRIERLTGEEKITLEQAGQFIEVFRENLRVLFQAKEREKKREVVNRINELFGPEGLVGYLYTSDLRDDCQPLIRQGEKNMVRALVSDIASRDIQAFSTSLREADLDYSGQIKADRIVSDVLRSNLVSGIDRIPSEMGLKTIDEFEDIDLTLWFSLKKAEPPSRLFSEQIKKTDEAIYAHALDEALKDSQGKYIQRLSYYPRPETIKTLVLLAAADYQNYRTVHANSVLSRLARREDWPAILEAAEGEYPGLGKAHQVLLNWNLEEYASHPELRGYVEDFALSHLVEGEDHPRALVLARESLSTEKLLTGLVRKGDVTVKEALTLKQATALLEKIRETGEGKPYVISGFTFNQTVREHALNIDTAQDEKKAPFVECFKRLIQAAERMNINADNPALVEYLSSDQSIQLLAKVPSEKVDLVLNAPDICSALMGTVRGETLGLRKLLFQYDEQFLNQEGLEYFQRMADAYESMENQMVAIIGCVAEDELSRERAEILPQKARALLQSDEFYYIIKRPQFFLSTDEMVKNGTRFLREAKEKGVDLQVLSLLTERNIFPQPEQLSQALDQYLGRFFEVAAANPKTMYAFPSFARAGVAMVTAEEQLKVFGQTLENFSKQPIHEKVWEAHQTTLGGLFEKSGENANRVLEIATKREGAGQISLLRFYSENEMIALDSPQDFQTFQNFVNEIGIFKSPRIFEAYKFLDQGEKGEFPESLGLLGITPETKGKKAFFAQEIQRMRRAIILTGQMVRPESELEAEVLGVEGRFNVGRFTRGATRLDSLVQEYYRDQAEGKIAPLPERYQTANFEMDIVIGFDISVDARKQVKTLIDQANRALGFKETPLSEIVKTYNGLIKGEVELKIAGMREGLEKQREDFEAKRKEPPKDFNEQKEARSLEIRTQNVERNIANFNQFLKRIERFEDLIGKLGEEEMGETAVLEQLRSLAIFTDKQAEELTEGLDPRNQAIQLYLKTFLNFEEAHFRKKGSPQLSSTISSLTMLHCFENAHAIGISEDVREGIGELIETEETSLATLTQLYEFVNIIIKEHSLEISNLSEPQKRRVIKNLNINALRQDIENYNRSEAGATKTITCVPTRGVLAELSGDLADACWTRTRNIMRDNPKMIADIFVENIEDPLRTKSIGACLLIETTINGEPAIVLRGINPRQELFDQGGMPLSFLKNYIDDRVVGLAEELAKERGASRALIVGPRPGTGAFSNRPGIRVAETFNQVSTGQPVELDETLNFNNYDITTRCELIRVVETEEAGATLKERIDRESGVGEI